MRKPLFCLLLAGLLHPATGAASETLTLEAYYRQVRERSLAFGQASEQLAARRHVLEEQASYFYPTVSVSGGYTYLRRAGDPLAAFTAVEGDALAVGVGLSQPLYTGGVLAARYRLAETALEAAGLDTDRLELELAFQARQAYIAVLRARKQADIARELVENRERQLADVSARVRVGMLARLEQLRAEVELANSRNGLLAAENGVRAAYSVFNRLREQPLDETPALRDIAPEALPDAGALEPLMVDALGARPELAAARLAVRQAGEGEMAVRGGLYPQVQLTVSREYRQDDAFRSAWRDVDQLGVYFSWDVWNRGRVRARIEETRALARAAALREEELARTIGLEVKRAWLDLMSARDRAATVEKAIEQAREVLRMQRIRFAEGMATPTEVMDAEFALAQADTNYYNALYDYLAAEAALLRSSGAPPPIAPEPEQGG